MTGRHQRFFANTQNDRYDTQNLTLSLSNLTQPSPIRRGLTRLSVFGRGNYSEFFTQSQNDDKIYLLLMIIFLL